MKHRVLLTFALAALAIAGWAVWAVACDKEKQTSAQASACVHPTDAKAAVAGGSCSAHGAKATTASVAAGSGCSAHGAKGVTATVAGSGGTCSSGAKAEAGCGGFGMPTTTAVSLHSDCEACSDMANCEEQLQASAAQRQVVPLKNGVMFVYTADTPSHVRAVQSALSRRADRLFAIAASGDRAKLCPECKTMRGAIASGKLTRETVNIEGGCLTLMTSNDPAIVARLHSMVGVTVASRNKS